jgi:pimeloyl-ACP methyl ester carboxylesterase
MSPQLQAWQQAGTFLTWQGHRIFYRMAGSGPGLLLLHGYPANSYDWHRVWEPLCTHFTLIAPDMLGMGFSDKPTRYAYTIAQHARMHEALLAHLGIHQIAFAAYDLGVSVAQEMLAAQATAPSALEITDITFLNGGICPEAYRARFIQKLLATAAGHWLGPKIPQTLFSKTISKLFGPHTQPSPELLADFWALYCHGGGRAINHLVGRFWLDRIEQRDRLVNATLQAKMPMRLINGAADPNSGWHMAMAFQRLHPMIPIIKLEGIGHWPQIEDPARVARELITRRLVMPP